MSFRKNVSMYAVAVRVAICLCCMSFVVYIYIDQQNTLTELRRLIPKLEKQSRRVNEDNVSLQYEIDQFREPRHLLELARKPQYRHLRFPSSDEVIIVEKGTSDVEKELSTK